MPLPPLMQKGLTALLNAVKLTDPTSLNQTVTTLEQHFTLSTYEIAQSYQKSYEQALKAIIAGLGNSSILDSKVRDEFARQIFPDYLQPFAARHGIQSEILPAFCTNSIAKCEALIQHTDLLFQGEQTQLTESDLAALVTDTGTLALTELVLEQLQKATELDDQFVAFLRYNDLLGTAILFFLDEELRQNERFRATLTALQGQGLWIDVREIKELLNQVMTSGGLSAQIKARDEFTHHNTESLKRIRDAFAKFNRLPANNPQYSQLAIMSASVLSSTGALSEAEKSLIEARNLAQNEADRALAAFNLFQIRLRLGDLEQALTDLQMAIDIDPHRYALHDVDRYPIERILGVGGMGVVFLCRHKLQKQRVAVKCFWEPRKGRAEEVFKEAFLMSDIAGEYVPTPLDYGYVDTIKQERAFFISEYIDGAMDGERWLERQGKLNLEEGLQVGLQIAKALQAAHQKGILHLDIKPANILLKRISSGLTVKVIDFGLAQVASSLRQEAVKQQRSRSGLSVLGQAIFGTVDYACPEQQGFEEYGKPSVQCDVFAFGKTLYRLLSGKHPRHNLRQRDLPNVPQLYELLEDCVEEEPSSRPESAPALIDRLKAIENRTGQRHQAKRRVEEKRRQEEVAKRQAEKQSQEITTTPTQRGSSILDYIPLFFVVWVLYHIGFMAGIIFLDPYTLFAWPLPSGAEWVLTGSDIFIILAVITLYFKILLASKSGRTFLGHSLSMLMFIVFLVDFLLVEPAGTSAFLIITFMSLLNVIAGFVINAAIARRELIMSRRRDE